MKKYKVLANFMFAFHIFWIILLIGGMTLSVMFNWYKPIHLIVLSSTIIAQILFLGCPVVTLEQALRRKYNPALVYTGSFTAFLLRKIFKRQIPAYVVALLLVVVLGGNILYFLISGTTLFGR